MVSKEEMKAFGWVIAGTLLFSITINMCMVPLNLFIGGVMGIAQLVRSFLVEGLHIEPDFDIAGIVNMLLNLPLFMIAFKGISRHFFALTVVSVVTQMVALTIIPIMPIVSDTITSVVIAGLVGGYGVGLCLRYGGSAGGMDILGFYLTMKSKNFSIGKLTIFVNAIIYSICALKFDLTTAIYSVIYIVIFGIVVDKVHSQNIVMSAMIFTKNKDVKKEIMAQLHRGVTYWHGLGAYTETEQDILMTVISKYEVNQLKELVHSLDERAFIIISEGMQVSGNYERRLL